MASIAGIVEVAETLAAVKSSMVAGSAYIGSVRNGLFPWQKTAGKPLPQRPILQVEDIVMAGYSEKMGTALAEADIGFSCLPAIVSIVSVGRGMVVR